MRFDTSKSDRQFHKPASNEKLLRLLHKTSKDNEEFCLRKDTIDWFNEL
jgi:hypothetical protein